MPELRIGTSGWNYPSGRGTWNGVFYPLPGDRPAGFDELTFYADRFDTVEVNSTFYGQPRAEVSRSWVQRTPASFAFSVKLYQKFTHPEMFKQSLTRGLPGLFDGPESTAGDAGLLARLAALNQVDIDVFKRGIDPLAESGRLGALLAQFPASFRHEPASVDYLDGVLRAFAGYEVAVELRHRSWSDAMGRTLALLGGHGAALVQIDEPKFRFSIQQNQLPNVKGFYYMRLHGRNAAQWWQHDHMEDRYNYLYSATELKPIAESAASAQRLVKKAYLYTNNHYSAKSVANANMLKQQVGIPIHGDYPKTFADRYPELAASLRVRA